MEAGRIIRVVIASPGDVQDERNAAVVAVDGVNQLLKDGGFTYRLELARWETDAYPGMHVDGPQALIDTALKIEDSDILVGIFWNRLGTPIPDARSGTEHEIRKGITAWKNSGHPRVMLYFCEAPSQLNSVEQLEQRRSLVEFKAELLNTDKPLVWHYQNLNEFAPLLGQQLWKHVMSIVNSETYNSSPLRFSVSTDPVHVRAEGMTELLGDIFLECTYVGSTTPRDSSLFFGLVILLGTNVTSRFLSSRFSDGLSGDPVLLEMSRDNMQPCRRASTVRANSVAFSSVPLDGMKPGEKRVFRVTNIRANVAGLGGGAMVGTTQLLAIVSVGSVEFPVQVLATIGQGLHFTVLRLDDSVTPQASWRDHAFAAYQDRSLVPQKICHLRFAEGFPNAFKSRAPRAFSTWNRWTVGKVYHSESCWLGAVLQMGDGQVIFNGLADYGTRLRTEFHNIPRGVRLYVSIAGVRGSVHAELVETESTVASTDEMIAGVAAREILLTDGVGWALWEVNSEPGRGWPTPPLAYLDFGLFSSFEALPEQNLPPPGTGTVNGSFAPIPPRPFSARAGSAASETLPLPRFADTSSATNVIRILLPGRENG